VVGLIVGGILAPPAAIVAFPAVAIPIFYAIWRYLKIRCETYELTSERIRVSRGVINQHIDEVELYRVKDTLTLRTWWMRLTGLATIKMETSDRTQPTLEIPAIRGGMELRENLRKCVETQRDRKRVREMDFEDSGDAV
jgi:uncharacterized membrane protein YdbT with pleckstrin-like domain